MGSANSKNGSKGPIPEYRPDFEVIRVIDDPNYGRVKLIREKKTHQQMILKEFIFDTKQAFEEEVRFFRERASFDHPNLVQVLGYNSTHNQNLCSTLFKVSVFIEILAKELSTVLKERKRNNNQYTEQDILLLAENVVSALYELQTRNMAHGDIRPLNIFVLGQTYKVTDPKLEIDKNANGLVKAVINKSKTLLSPELLARVPTGKFEFTEDKYKADVFSLGMTLLHAATLNNSEELYDYERGRIDERLLAERLEEVRQKYSPFTYQLISDMLRFKENERPDFVALRNTLLPYQEAIRLKSSLPFLTGPQDHLSGPATMAHREKEGGKKKAAVRMDQDLNVEDPRQIASRAGDYSINVKPPQRNEQDVYHYQQNPPTFGELNSTHTDAPASRSTIPADDLEARIRAALQKSYETYEKIQASDHDNPYIPQNQQFQPQAQGGAGFRPVSFGTNQGLDVQQRFEQNQTVNAGVERSQNAERNVKAFRQVGFDQETNVSRNVHDAPRQIGFEQGRHVQDERRVNAFRQVGFEQETNVSRNVHDAPRQIGFEQAVRSAPRQANEEAAQQIKAPVAEQAQFNVAAFQQQQQQVNVPTQNFTSVQQQHFNVGQDRGFGQFDIGNNAAFNRPVEYQQPGFPATTISHETNYQSSHITPSLATQNLDLLESLKRSNEASLAHQQDIQKHIYSQSFGQPTNFEQNVPQHTTTYEAIQSYQPVNIEGLHSTNYNVTSTGLGEHYARNVTGEHAVRSIPGSFASHEVRTVGESIPNYQPVNIEALHSTNYNVTSTGLSGDHYTRNITGEHAVRSSPGGFVSHEVRTGGDNIHSYQPVNTEALYSTNYNITSTGLGEHSYQPVNIEALHSTNYNVTSTGLSGDHYTRNVTGEHAVRSIPGGFASHDVPSTGLGGDHYIRNVTGEHAVRSSPGAAAHDVRKVGEVAGNSTINTAPFTYTTTNYTAGQDVARFGQQKAAEDVMAFSQTHTAGHDFGAQQYQIGGIGSTQEHYFTSTTGHADVGAGMNADIERILKGYQTGDTNVQVQGLAYSPTLERHQVGDIQVGGFAKTDTVTYHGEQHMPGGFADVHVEQSPGGILGEVNSAVSKYTLTGDDAFQHHAQFDGSPTRFV